MVIDINPASLNPTYRGRFAPSPTGRLHLGSLFTAVASYLRARSCNGSWIVRMEDLDPPRAEVGAADAILKTLRAFGLEADAPICFQSQRHTRYRAALRLLESAGLAFACACSRTELAPSGRHHGVCQSSADATACRRLWVPAAHWQFTDHHRGSYHQHSGTVGDFVLWRADGLPAYQLAVVVDDAAQGITEVVRGNDLLDSTPRQIYLQQRLALPTPHYLHLPVLIDQSGNKLSKSTAALAVADDNALPTLKILLKWLGQPDQNRATSVRQLLLAASAAFDPRRIPQATGIRIDGGAHYTIPAPPATKAAPHAVPNGEQA